MGIGDDCPVRALGNVGKLANIGSLRYLHHVESILGKLLQHLDSVMLCCAPKGKASLASRHTI